MRGLELMLMGLYTMMQNGTDYTDDHPAKINDELDLSKLDISLADENSKDRNITMPMEIKVTSVQNMPYSGLKNVNGTWMGEGYAFHILHLIQEKLNFTYTIIPPKQMIIGDKNSGIMNLLHKQKVDMAVAFIPMLTDLKDLCTFSTIMDDVEITFLMIRPSESATGQGILAPFNDTVWLCILITWIIVGPTMYILIFIRSKVSSNNSTEQYSLSTCMWFTYGALLKQGTTTEPVTNSTRLLFATWWIFITILTSFYTANLTAFLTLSEFTLPYNSAKDIVDKRQKWVSLEEQTVHDVLKRHNSGGLGELKKSPRYPAETFIPRNEDYATILEWVERDRIFLGDRHFITSIISDDYKKKTIKGIEETKRCTYVMLPDDIYVLSRAFAFSKKSPLEEHINKHLMNLVETGIVKHLQTMDLPSVNICPLNLKSKERRLRNTDLSMTYEVMIIGFVLSTIMFLGEMTYRYVCLHRCGKCCSRLCCRKKLSNTPILPMHIIDPRPEYLKEDPFNDFANLHREHGVEKNFINGREYWVIKERDGDRRLIPMRTPSALLFHYNFE